LTALYREAGLICAASSLKTLTAPTSVSASVRAWVLRWGSMLDQGCILLRDIIHFGNGLIDLTMCVLPHIACDEEDVALPLVLVARYQ
jgi:hypothetical protein